MVSTGLGARGNTAVGKLAEATAGALEIASADVENSGTAVARAGTVEATVLIARPPTA
jgi:hypothetical protein